MTERLYYDDAFLPTFEARVAGIEAEGGGVAVWLDRSAFYPESGGQPFDTGTLGGLRVLSVDEDGDGRVVHHLEGVGPELAVGDTVHGEIDWTRRFDHMQQHTGQHLLSAVIARDRGVATRSFHLGASASTIDIERELTGVEIGAVENAANAVLWENRRVKVAYAEQEDACALALRKPSTRSGRLRLVDIEGIDLSACGGTHVSATGQIGQIAIVSWERFKGGQRLEFVCGARALARFQTLRDTVTAASRLLSSGVDDLAGGIARLQGDIKDQRRALAAMQSDLARHEGAALAAAAESIGGSSVVLHAVDGDAQRLRTLASATLNRQGVIAVIVSAAAPLSVVIARSTDVPVACDRLLALLSKEFGGRGGGRPDFANGGGLNASADVVLAFARSALQSLASPGDGVTDAEATPRGGTQ